MIGYENDTHHHGYAAMCRAEAEQDAFERRVEELAAEIVAAPFDADDFYCAADRMSETEQKEIADWVQTAGLIVPYQLRFAMEKARELRAERQAVKQAEAELKSSKYERGGEW